MSVALDTRTILETLRPRREAVRRRLAAVRRRVRATMLLVGVTWTWTAVFLFAAVSLAADWLLRLSLPVRLSALAAAAVVVAVVAWRRLVSPLLLRLDDLDLAAVLDRRCPGVAQRVASVLQLPGLIEGRVTASPAMVEAAVLEQVQALDRTDFRSAFDRRAQMRMLALLLATGLLAGVFAYCWPQTTGLWARRWFLGSYERWPQANYLSLVGLGDQSRLLVPRGESLLIEVDAAPQFAERAGVWRLSGRGETLTLSSPQPPTANPPETVAIRYRPADGPAKQGNFTRYSDTRFRYEIPQVSEPLEASITGGDDWFGPIRIEPIDRPAITSLVIRARCPGRDEVDTHTAEGGDSQLLFLPDTDLTLELTASVPLSEAWLREKDGVAPDFERRDETRFAARWTMKEPQTFEIALVSREGSLSSKPYFVSIGLLIDRAPRVSIRSSGVGRRVTPQARIPLVLHAADDFGMTALGLQLEQTLLKDEKPKTKTDRVAIELPPFTPDAAPTDLDEQPTLTLGERSLSPGTLLKVRGQATDNRAAYSSPLAPREESDSSPLAPREESDSSPLAPREESRGPQTGSSRWLTFQVVTPEELFYEILMRQRAERAKFAAALETAKTQTAPLAGAASAEVAFGLVRKHQVIARQVWQVANRLEVSLTEMELNDLGSQQARDLLQTSVIDTIRQLHAEPMARLRVALEAISADQGAAEPLADARQLQQEVIDKMTKILEQMSQWENFVDVLNQLKAIVKLQSGVLDATEAEKKKRTQDLFDD